jgi:phosphomannomutase/phosphoglucomutase
MLSVPVAELTPNTYAYESQPMVKPTGFREYDARWLFEKEINLMGIQALGMGIATLMRERGTRPDIVVGHDFRSYSAAIKMALISGLMAGGVRVHDIGLALSPMAYFAQFALDVPAVAMVTASHNDNGWTGVKMGIDRPLTFGPDEMGRLKEIVLTGAFREGSGGGYRFVEGFAETYIKDLTDRAKLSRPIKVVAACGNGTAGAFAPRVLEALGAEVIPLDCELDHTFPRYNPNPEDMKMLHALRDKVLETGAEVGLGFDGDGDRCGVVDNSGAEIFADTVGVMLARDLSELHPNCRFVVDVKSTGLFATDPVLKANGATTDYWKTGHSYIKRRVNELDALVGFEKSGHYFFNTPIGRGYDDGLVSAIAILDMLDRNPGKVDGRSSRCPAEDLGIADDVAALRGRDQIRGGRPCRRAVHGDEGKGRDDRRTRDRRPRHRQRRTRRRRRRHMGARARLLQQARARRRDRKPGLEGPPPRDVQGGRHGLAGKPGSRRLQPDDLGQARAEASLERVFSEGARNRR